MSPELIAILTVGIGLCALIYQTSRSLRLDVRNDISQLRLEMDQLRQEVKDDINQLRQELDQLRQEIRMDLGHITERVARIEGMLTPKPWSGQDPTSPKTQTG